MSNTHLSWFLLWDQPDKTFKSFVCWKMICASFRSDSTDFIIKKHKNEGEFLHFVIWNQISWSIRHFEMWDSQGTVLYPSLSLTIPLLVFILYIWTYALLQHLLKKTLKKSTHVQSCETLHIILSQVYAYKKYFYSNF